MHHVLFILICLIWGASFILMKKAHLAIGPVSIAAGRTILGAAVLLVLVWIKAARRNNDPGATGKAARGLASDSDTDTDKLRRLRLSVAPLRGIARRDLPWVLIPGLIGLAYPWAMQPYLIGHYQASGFFGMMVSLVPLLTIVVSIPLLGVFPSRRELIGVLGGFVCLYVLFDDGQSRGITAVSFVLAVTVPLSYALSNTIIKRRLSHVPTQPMSALALLIAAMVLTPVGVATEGIHPAATADTIGWAVAAIAFLGVMGSGVAILLLYYLIQRRGPLFAGMTTYGVSTLAVAWGWVDAEHVTTTQVVALIGVLAMVALVQWPGRKTKTAADAV